MKSTSTRGPIKPIKPKASRNADTSGMGKRATPKPVPAGASFKGGMKA